MIGLEKSPYMLERNSLLSQELGAGEETSLDIFEEAIGKLFAQCPSNNRRDSANREEEGKRVVSLAFCEYESRTNDTPLFVFGGR